MAGDWKQPPTRDQVPRPVTPDEEMIEKAIKSWTLDGWTFTLVIAKGESRWLWGNEELGAVMVGGQPGTDRASALIAALQDLNEGLDLLD